MDAFPLFRGAEEWYIARLPAEPPPIDLLILTTSDRGFGPGSVTGAQDFPFRRVTPVVSSGEWSADLRALERHIDPAVPYCAIVARGYEPVGSAWVWEAIRLFELHQDVAAVGGRLVDDRQMIVDTGRRRGMWSRQLGDFVGLHRLDPGPVLAGAQASLDRRAVRRADRRGHGDSACCDRAREPGGAASSRGAHRHGRGGAAVADCVLPADRERVLDRVSGPAVFRRSSLHR